MRTYFIKVLVFLSMFLPTIVNAGQYNNATVLAMKTDVSGMVVVTIDGGSEITSPASCTQSSSGREFIYDLNSVAGKGWHSVALTALSTGKSINIVGANGADGCMQLDGQSFEKIRQLFIMK